MSLLGDLIGFDSAGRAAGAVSNSAIAAEHGVLGATQDAQAGINSAVQGANTYVPAAGEQAAATVGGAVSGANTTLQQHLDTINAGTQPYQASGVQGNTTLQDYVASKPTFSFNPGDLTKDPGYQFQLQQGTDAITNRSAAMGLGASGSTLKELGGYATGLAGQYYNDAFNRAQSTFSTNQNTTMANIKALIDAGEFGTGVSASAENNTGQAQAKNTVAGGLITAATDTDLAKYLAGLNVGGATTAGTLGIEGANAAGKLAVTAGEAHGAGILGQGKALGGIAGDVLGIASPLVGSIPTGSGSATTLAGILGGP